MYGVNDGRILIFPRQSARRAPNTSRFPRRLTSTRLTAQAKDLEVQAAEPGLWDNPENAQKVTSKLSAVQSQLKRLASASPAHRRRRNVVELGQEEEDADTLAEAQSEVESIQNDLPTWKSRPCSTANMTNVPQW